MNAAGSQLHENPQMIDQHLNEQKEIVTLPKNIGVEARIPLFSRIEFSMDVRYLRKLGSFELLSGTAKHERADMGLLGLLGCPK